MRAYIIAVLVVLSLMGCNKAQTDSIKLANMGVRAYTRGDFEHAEHMFKSAIQVFPQNAMAHYHLGLLYLYHKNDPKAAANEFKLAIQYDSNLGPAYLQLGRTLYKLQNLDSAIKYLTRAVKLLPDDPAPLFWMGKAMEAKGNYTDADDYYRHAIKVNPHYSRAFCALADMYIKAGAYPETLSVLKEDIRINKTDYYGYERLGHINLMLGQYKEAAKAYTMALNLHPNNPLYYLNLAAAYVGMNRYDRAAEFLKLFVVQAKGKYAQYVEAARLMYDRVSRLAAQ